MLAPDEIFARRYRIVRVLGRGAMGVVHEAVHEQLGRRVAIKVLRHGDGDDERAVRRFEREARLAAKLGSPHVVRVSDVDRTEDGIPYLVMELLEGRDLAQEVEAREKDGPIPCETAASWAMAVAEAMNEAHDAGIVHRDLKLSNLFLTNEGSIKVLDFGVASFRGGDAESSTTTSVAGTPRYMAPEQLLGEAPNPASDVWALGVILYRLLAGVFPYDAPTMAAQMLAIMDGVKRLDEIAPRVPKALADVVHRALGRTLEERWPSMRDLESALAPFAAKDPAAEAAVLARAKLEANERAFDEARAKADAREHATEEDERGQRRGKGFVIVLAVVLVAVIIADFVRRDGPKPESTSPNAGASAATSGSASASPPPSFTPVLPTPSAPALPMTPTASASAPVTTTSPRAPAGSAPPASTPRASGAASAPPPRDDGFPAHL